MGGSNSSNVAGRFPESSERGSYQVPRNKRAPHGGSISRMKSPKETSWPKAKLLQGAVCQDEAAVEFFSRGGRK